MDHFPTATRPRRVRLRPLPATRPAAASSSTLPLAAAPETTGDAGEDPHSRGVSLSNAPAVGEPADPLAQTLALLGGGIIGLLALAVPLAAVLVEPSAAPAGRPERAVRPVSAAGSPRSPAPGRPVPDPRIPPR